VAGGASGYWKDGETATYEIPITTWHEVDRGHLVPMLYWHRRSYFDKYMGQGIQCGDAEILLVHGDFGISYHGVLMKYHMSCTGHRLLDIVVR